MALLVGIAQDRGRISLDDPVSEHLGIGWASFADSEDQITIRHLLTMTSGLDARYVTVADPGVLVRT